MSHPNKFFTSDDIYEKLWQASSFKTVTVRKHISTIRKKLLDATNGKDFILTQFGVGYAFAGDMVAV